MITLKPTKWNSFICGLILTKAGMRSRSKLTGFMKTPMKLAKGLSLSKVVISKHSMVMNGVMDARVESGMYYKDDDFPEDPNDSWHLPL